MVKNPNWQEADQLSIYKAWPRIWTRDDRVQIANQSYLEVSVKIVIMNPLFIAQN